VQSAERTVAASAQTSKHLNRHPRTIHRNPTVTTVPEIVDLTAHRSMLGSATMLSLNNNPSTAA
jgi:hypothetical protein